MRDTVKSETESKAGSPKAQSSGFSNEQETLSHIPVRPLYTPADLEGWDYDKQVGYPGQFPFTQGVQATMSRGRLWTMRQYAGMGDAEESNKRYKYLLSHGTTGLSVAFDLPTQIGMDSDHSMSLGEVGKVGVAIDSVEDMERLFNGIDLTKISTSMTINATAAILLALYVAVARRQGADIRKLSGTVQNDVLKEYIARGTYIYPPEQALRIITDVFAWTNESVPDWNTISIDEALALPTEEAARIALRTQQIIAFESGVPQTIDPVAGSYYLESLTSEIERRATEYLDKIDGLGGMLKAIERGYVQQEIQNAAYEYQQKVDRSEAVVVGVNGFTVEEESAVPILRIDPALEPRQVERLRAMRLRRDKKPWEAALERIEEAARSGDNLMPRIIGAVEAHATVGEISDTLRKVFGEYKEAVVI